MRLVHTHFTVTAGGVVEDSNGRVLLLKHRFRGGSGWGIPGGFIELNEQPSEALKRELREEVGIEIEVIRIIAARSFGHIKQIEILFYCRANENTDPMPQNREIKKADWFPVNSLPDGLPSDQKQILLKTIGDRATPAG
jgi:mutator protein MutT